MQLTIDRGHPLDDVLRVLGAMYGVRLTVATEEDPPATGAPPAGSPARRTRPQRQPASRRGRTVGRRADVDAGAVRAWARQAGLTVSTRGRVPAAVLKAYEAAQT